MKTGGLSLLIKSSSQLIDMAFRNQKSKFVYPRHSLYLETLSYLLYHLTSIIESEKSENRDTFADLKIKAQTLPERCFTKLWQFIFAELNIYPTEVKTIKNKRIRAHHRAVTNWITTYYKPGLSSLKTEAIQNFCKEVGILPLSHFRRTGKVR